MAQNIDMSLLAGLDVLTLSGHRPTPQVEKEDPREVEAWEEIQSARRSHKVLTGILAGIEDGELEDQVAVLQYGEYRVVLPISEMMILNEADPITDVRKQQLLVSAMLGAEIDFIVKGMETKTKSIVGSRKEALMKKREFFYFRPGRNQISKGRIAEARVIAVGTAVIRVEVFGAEASITSRNLFWDWVADAHEKYSVGDRIFVRVIDVQGESPENLTVQVEARTLTRNISADNIQKCKLQGKYIGTVTDIRRGLVYLRLSNGVNTLALNCFDSRTPGKGDVVSFVVTKIEVDRALAVGLITKIIKQNL